MYIIGIDLGGTQIKIVTIDGEGKFLEKLSEPTEDNPGENLTWAQKVATKVTDIENKMGAPAHKIGLSAPGLASPDNRYIFHMPGRMFGLEKLDWTQYLERENPVPVLNDAHAALYGEHWLGAAKDYQNALMLTLGTGIGGAALINGKILTGSIGRAGHFGHISINYQGEQDDTNITGSLENYLGDKTLLKRSNGKFTSTQELVEAYKKGDQDAVFLWKDSIHALACGISSLINCFDPEVFILGGGITQAGNTLWDPLLEAMDKVEWRPAGHQVMLKPALLGSYSGAVGAARFAILQDQFSQTV